MLSHSNLTHNDSYEGEKKNHNHIVFSQASRILGIPPILTEQYPKGLGSTVPELGAADLTAHAKTSFTMMIEEVEKQLEALGNPKQAILCGIEAHACIAVRTHNSLDH